MNLSIDLSQCRSFSICNNYQGQCLPLELELDALFMLCNSVLLLCLCLQKAKGWLAKLIQRERVTEKKRLARLQSIAGVTCTSSSFHFDWQAKGNDELARGSSRNKARQVIARHLES